MSAVPAFLDWAKARGVEQLAVEVYVDDVLGTCDHKRHTMYGEQVETNWACVARVPSTATKC
jgi:hypothetical protein